ncbi:MAG: SH3 domain-containing protein [Clostridiaceae bacterium]
MKKKSVVAIIIASIGAVSGAAYATKKYMDKKKEKSLMESDEKRFVENLDRPEVEVTALARLRSEPSSKAQIVDWVKEGTLLEYLESLDEWFKVKYQDDIAYISKKYAVR